MILFINTYITEEKIATQGRVVRENAKHSDKLDIYKYMLASLSKYYPWKRVIINTKLDNYYLPRQSELQNFIEKEFEGQDLMIRFDRNEYQKDWQKEFDNFNDNLILYLGNHDHIFTDSDTSYIKEIIAEFENTTDEMSILFSHWPEAISYPWCRVHDVHNFVLGEKYLQFDQKSVDSIQIISKALYHHWWFDFKLPDVVFGRTDMFNSPIDWYGDFHYYKVIIPYKEICRHFDAYQHCHYPYLNQAVPVLEIPDGFFENDIKINYSTIYKQGFTNINPVSDSLKIFNPEGFDLNITKKFIPEFWKNRISEFKDDFVYLSDAWPEQEVDKLYLDRILRYWNHLPIQNANNCNFIKNKITEYYYKTIKKA